MEPGYPSTSTVSWIRADAALRISAASSGEKCLLQTEHSKELARSAASNLRAHSESKVGAPVVIAEPHAAAISKSSERQRDAKSRRCSARGMESPRPRRQRKYCRNSSNAEQKRAADAKLPKPRIG